MWQRFTPDSRTSILRAQNIALVLQSASVSSSHLFLALIETAAPDNSLGSLFLAAGLKQEEARLYVEASLAPSPDFSENAEPKLTPDAKRVLEFAAREAVNAGDQFIETEHMLFACLQPQKGSTLPATLAPLGWDLSALRARRRELRHLPPVRHPENPLELLTDSSKAVIDGAYSAMRATYCGRISTAHLLLALLENEHAVELFTTAGVAVDELKVQTRAAIRSDAIPATAAKRFDKGAKRALDRAKTAARERGYLFIGPDHLLLGLLPHRATAREKLTWGAQVPDEAAHLLDDVDSARIRQLLEPTSNSQPVPRQKAPSRDVPREAPILVFCAMCVIGAILGVALSLSSRRPSSPASLFQIMGISAMLFLLVGSALGACWMLMRSRKPHLKSAWVSAFAGLLVGIMLTIMMLNR